LDKFERKGGKSVSPPLRPPPVHRDIAAVDIAKVVHPLAKAVPSGPPRLVAENSDPRELRRLLRERDEGRSEKAACKRADEIAPVNH
jgi:hypothetical protein